jgi:hypothetical protein
MALRRTTQMGADGKLFADTGGQRQILIAPAAAVE